MAIDNCKYSFSELTSIVLPRYMNELQKAPFLNVRDFSEPNIGPSKLTKKLNMKDEQGLYVLYEDQKPNYVGISRRMISRIRQHVTGKTHYDASLVFRMTSKSMGKNRRRDELMKDPDFVSCFVRMQEQVMSMKVRFVPVDNEVELYLLEVCAAMELNTSEWNTFRTH